MNTRFLGRWPYLVLGIAFLVCVVTYWTLPVELEGWRGFFLNTLTEILGILLTVLLIDEVLRRREKRERDRYRSLALGRIWRPLNRHLSLFSNIYKASARKKPKGEIAKAEDLFGEDFFRQVPRLDLMAESGTTRHIGDVEIMPWYEVIEMEMDSFRQELEKVIDKYAMYLDIDTIDAAERLIDSHLRNVVRIGRSLATSRATGIKKGPVPLMMFEHHGVDDPIKEYADALLELAKIYDQTASEDRKTRIADATWRSDMLPAIGSARIPDRLLKDQAKRGPE